MKHTVVLKDSGIIIIGDCWQPLFARQLIEHVYRSTARRGDVKIYYKKRNDSPFIKEIS